jgi:hypothetical protein
LSGASPGKCRILLLVMHMHGAGAIRKDVVSFGGAILRLDPGTDDTFRIIAVEVRFVDRVTAIVATPS